MSLDSPPMVIVAAQKGTCKGRALGSVGTIPLRTRLDRLRGRLAARCSGRECSFRDCSHEDA